MRVVRPRRLSSDSPVRITSRAPGVSIAPTVDSSACCAGCCRYCSTSRIATLPACDGVVRARSTTSKCTSASPLRAATRSPVGASHWPRRLGAALPRGNLWLGPGAIGAIGSSGYVAAARELASLVRVGVLLKVGHWPGVDPALMQDLWAARGQAPQWLEPLARVGEDVRGTGCQLASAILAERVGGGGWLGAVQSARRYLGRLLHRRAMRPGQGRAIIIRA